MSSAVFCALDTPNISEAKQWAHSLHEYIDGIKIGMEFYYAHGAAGIQKVRPQNMPLFLDLKIHDIPNTASKALKSLTSLKADFLTLHASGGLDMMKACVETNAQLDHTSALLAVSVLTSLDQQDLTQMGIPDTPAVHVSRLAHLAQMAGCDGLVCSPHELRMLRAECDRTFKLVVPGIRPETHQKGDQKRVMTPCQAQESGADYLVIGRAITHSSDPVVAARQIKSDLQK